MPLAFTLALILLLQYTVLSSALNLSAQLNLAKTVLIVVNSLCPGFFLIQKGHSSVLLVGFDTVNDHLDIDDVFPTILSWDETLLVVANFGEIDLMPQYVTLRSSSSTEITNL
jgi:hypothetical protein